MSAIAQPTYCARRARAGRHMGAYSTTFARALLPVLAAVPFGDCARSLMELRDGEEAPLKRHRCEVEGSERVTKRLEEDTTVAPIVRRNAPSNVEVCLADLKALIYRRAPAADPAAVPAATFKVNVGNRFRSFVGRQVYVSIFPGKKKETGSGVVTLHSVCNQWLRSVCNRSHVFKKDQHTLT